MIKKIIKSEQKASKPDKKILKNPTLLANLEKEIISTLKLIEGEIYALSSSLKDYDLNTFSSNIRKLNEHLKECQAKAQTYNLEECVKKAIYLKSKAESVQEAYNSRLTGIIY